MSQPSRLVARRLLVHGRVQGVFFRASTNEVASRERVVGWVANRADGSVEVWLEGEAERVRAVERWIRSGGPPSASVSGVDAEDMAPAGHAGFQVVHG